MRKQTRIQDKEANKKGKAYIKRLIRHSILKDALLKIKAIEIDIEAYSPSDSASYFFRSRNGDFIEFGGNEFGASQVLVHSYESESLDNFISECKSIIEYAHVESGYHDAYMDFAVKEDIRIPKKFKKLFLRLIK